jgi:hypothetical protein
MWAHQGFRTPYERSAEELTGVRAAECVSLRSMALGIRPPAFERSPCLIERDRRIARPEAKDNSKMCPIWEDEVPDVGRDFSLRVVATGSSQGCRSFKRSNRYYLHLAPRPGMPLRQGKAGTGCDAEW